MGNDISDDVANDGATSQHCPKHLIKELKYRRQLASDIQQMYVRIATEFQRRMDVINKHGDP